MKQDMIVILDLGSHENTVLARAIRALGVYSEIYPHDITVDELKALPNVKGIIINGGPNNVIDGVAIDVNHDIYNAGFPVMAAGHDKALCDVRIAEIGNDVEIVKEAVREFVLDTCKAEKNWNMTNFVNDQVELIRRQVGDRKVLLALSGGVDSSVVAALLLKAIGNNLVCVHVNHGLMRKGESEAVIDVFSKQLCANLVYVDATDRFLDKLAGVADPEQKRKIIGGEFIRVFEEEARKLDGITASAAHAHRHAFFVQSIGIRHMLHKPRLQSALVFRKPAVFIFHIQKMKTFLHQPDLHIWIRVPILGLQCPGSFFVWLIWEYNDSFPVFILKFFHSVSVKIHILLLYMFFYWFL